MPNINEYPDDVYQRYLKEKGLPDNRKKSLKQKFLAAIIKDKYFFHDITINILGNMVIYLIGFISGIVMFLYWVKIIFT
jgi:hypothetical protein